MNQIEIENGFKHQSPNKILVTSSVQEKQGMYELTTSDLHSVAGGAALDGPISKQVQDAQIAGTTSGGTTSKGDYKSLWTFTTLATTPTCAIIIAVTFTKC